MRSLPRDSSGSAMLMVLFILMSAMGLVLVLFQRSETVRGLSRSSRFGQQAEALVLSALEEGRLRLASEANVPGTGVWNFLRCADPASASLTLDTTGISAMVAAGPAWPAMSVEPVSVRVIEPRRKVPGPGGEVSLDRAYGFGYIGQVRLAAAARVDRAERHLVQYFDMRLTNVRPPLPCDRVKFFLKALEGMEPEALGSILGRIMIDAGPEPPLAPKITSFVLHEEPAMAQSFAPLMPQPPDTFEPPLAAASYLLPTARAALRFLYPIEADPTAMVLPEGLAVVASALELPEFSTFRLHGVVACAGDLRVGGLIRRDESAAGDSLVLQTLGPDRRLRVDERPCEAALVAMGARSLVEPANGTTIPQVHGLLASAAPSGILTGILAFDPVHYNGKPEGPYSAPATPGTPAPLPGSADLDPAAYRFSMASFPTLTVAEVP